MAFRQLLNLGDSISNAFNNTDAASNAIQNRIGVANQDTVTGATDTNIAATNRDLPSPQRPEHRVRLTAYNFVRNNLDANTAARQVLFGKDDPNAADIQSHLLHPLKDHGGILFPYTPTITTDFQASYGEYTPIHSITDFQAYQRTPSPTFTVTTQLTVQNIDEGRYALACIHFARTVTKMYFGSKDPRGGTPPPILHFSGYGEYMFNKIPVVMTQYAMDFNADTDYVEIPVTTSNSKIQNAVNNAELNNCGTPSGASASRELNRASPLKSATGNAPYARAWLPSKFTFSVTLKVTRTPRQVRTFDLDEFRSGRLLVGGSAGKDLELSGGGWW